MKIEKGIKLHYAGSEFFTLKAERNIIKLCRAESILSLTDIDAITIQLIRTYAL